MRTTKGNNNRRFNMEYIGTYGNYSWNTSESYKKSRASKWKDDNGVVYYKSYSTIVAFDGPNGLVVSENCWSSTTGKHLNWISRNKDLRLDRSKFEEELKKVQNSQEKAPDLLKTVGMVSAMFGLLSENDKEAKVKFQKRFYEKVPGLQFPDDWDQLSTEEKEKRLNGVNKIALEKRGN